VGNPDIATCMLRDVVQIRPAAIVLVQYEYLQYFRELDPVWPWPWPELEYDVVHDPSSMNIRVLLVLVLVLFYLQMHLYRHQSSNSIARLQGVSKMA
jgi:hypothetical protein